MTVYYIPRGTGFKVGANFARAPRDMPVTIDESRSTAREVIGIAPGIPDSTLRFMRDETIVIRTRRDLLITR